MCAQRTEPAFIVRVDYDLHRAARALAAEAGMPVSEILRQWLRAWVAGNLPTPPKEEETLGE